jgi:molybdopterin converting factor small subunit
MTLEELAAELAAMKEDNAKLKEAVAASQKAPPAQEPATPKPTAPKSDAQLQKEVFEQQQTAARSQQKTEHSITSAASAKVFLDKELPSLEVSATVQAVIDSCPKEYDYVKRELWIKRAYVAEVVKGYKEEDLATMPKIYAHAIKTAQTSEKYGVNAVFNMVRELQDKAKEQAQYAARAEAMKGTNHLSKEELGKLPKTAQDAYHAKQAHQNAADKRWATPASV